MHSSSRDSKIKTAQYHQYNGQVEPAEAKLTVMDLFDQAFEGEDGFEGNCSPTNTHSTLKKNYEKSRFVNGEELSTTLMKKSPNKWKLLPEFNHEDGPGYVGTFRNAFISGPYSVVFDCNIEFFAGGCDFDKAAKFPLQKALVTPPTSMQRVEEAVLVGQHFGKHFYHWLVEGFLRLALVHEYLIENPNLKIIHYRQDNSAVFFEMLSIDPSRHVVYDPDEIYFVKKLIVPSATPCSRALSSAALVMNKLLRKAVAERFPHLNDAVKLQKIVVHKRKDGAERSFLNHKKLVRSLQARFKDTAEVVEFKHDDDAWEAAKLHYNADVIVTPHGAGASNVLFSKAHHAALLAAVFSIRCKSSLQKAVTCLASAERGA